MIELIFWSSFVLLLHTYVLYPLIATLVRRDRAASPSQELPSVSVLVPAHNEATVIGKKIDNFRSFEYPTDRLELLVYDDGSSDGTTEAALSQEFPRVRVLGRTDRSGKAAAVNELVAAAKHQTLLFTDANVLLHADAVGHLVRHLADPQIGAVTGEVRLVGSNEQFQSGESLYYRLERQIQRAESFTGNVIGVDGAMYVLRRELFQPLPADTILDDFLISMNVIRSSKRVVYDRKAQAIETGTLSSVQEYRRRVRIAAGAVQLLRRGEVPKWHQVGVWAKFLSHKLLRWCTPILLVLLFISCGMLALEFTSYRITWWLLLGLGLGMSLTLLSPRLRGSPFGAVLFYFAMSQLAMAMGIVKGVMNQQPPQWEKAQRTPESRLEGDEVKKL